MTEQFLIALTLLASIASIFIYWKKQKSDRTYQIEILNLLKKYDALGLKNQELQKTLTVYSSHQWDALAAIDRYVEIEQNRIAHDLHDDTIQRLVYLRLRLEQLHLFDLNDKTAIEVDAVRKEIDDIIKDIRFLIKGIPTNYYEKIGLMELFKNLHEKLKSILVRKIELRTQNPELEFNLETNVKIELFRMVQEAVQNALKHSIGSAIAIAVTWGDELVIDISDDGIGSWSTEKGTGSKSLQQRADRIGAKLKIINSSRGVYISIVLPKPGSSRPTRLGAPRQPTRPRS